MNSYHTPISLAGCGLLPHNFENRLTEATQEREWKRKNINFLNSSVSIKSLRKNEMTAPKVLLVEDDASNILVTSTFLENLGYDYDIAMDGGEALRKASKNIYSLILMDLSLPMMDGLVITKKLRNMERGANRKAVHIIAMTAHAFVEDRENCLEAGMNGYISKPFSEAQLQKTLEEYFSQPCRI